MSAVEPSGDSKTLGEHIASVQPWSGFRFIDHAHGLLTGLLFQSAATEVFDYSGRIDFSQPSAPVFIWQGSQLRFGFTGQRFALRFAEVEGVNHFNVIIDGGASLLRLKAGETRDYILDAALAPGRHELVLFKRSEAMSGTARFLGVFIEPGEACLAPDDKPQRTIEFYGDSITAGACDEDPDADQYDDLTTHNNYTSYAAVCSRILGVRYSNISFSGIGICASWHPLLMGRVWDRLYPRPDSQVYAFNVRPPDIVVINLGQNDHGFTADQGQPFPADFRERYVELIHAIRRRYPDAWIICAAGGMSAFRDSPALSGAWREAVGELADDRKIVSFVFKAFSYAHPRVDTHISLARELAAFIKRNIDLSGLSWNDVS